jgi:hypothetical protein
MKRQFIFDLTHLIPRIAGIRGWAWYKRLESHRDLGADATLDAWTEPAIPPSRAQSPIFADDTLLPFSLPSICQKKVTIAFDGGRISSDGGVLLLAGADKRLGLVDTLAGIIRNHRDQALVPRKSSGTRARRIRGRRTMLKSGKRKPLDRGQARGLGAGTANTHVADEAVRGLERAKGAIPACVP